jgi:hypothetical protein
LPDLNSAHYNLLARGPEPTRADLGLTRGALSRGATVRNRFGSIPGSTSKTATPPKQKR